MHGWTSLCRGGGEKGAENGSVFVIVLRGFIQREIENPNGCPGTDKQRTGPLQLKRASKNLFAKKRRRERFYKEETGGGHSRNFSWDGVEVHDRETPLQQKQTGKRGKEKYISGLIKPATNKIPRTQCVR